MAQVIVDPQELRRFAARLRHFSTEVLTQMQGVQRQLAALSATWRDQEQQKFAEQFEQAGARTQAFMNELREIMRPVPVAIGERAAWGLCDGIHRDDHEFVPA